MNTRKVLIGTAIGLGALVVTAWSINATTWAVVTITKAVKKKRKERLNKRNES